MTEFFRIIGTFLTENTWFLWILGFLNFVVFTVYALDKAKAKNHAWRIPETLLIGLALIGGATGAFLGMELCRHKTKHILFITIVPISFLVQMGLLIASYIAVM